MSHNLDLACSLIPALSANRVKHIVLCSGSFNSPVFAALSDNCNFIKYHHFEERSASFFALGLSKSLNQPVAVCITSGTAVAECLPAVIEAYYCGTALVVISADREETLSGSGYPQAIDQTGLLKNHCLASLDIKKTEDLAGLNIAPDGPLHINLRFKEPILENPDISGPISDLAATSALTDCSSQPENISAYKLLKNFKRPVVILDQFPKKKLEEVRSFLLDSGMPILAEARSSLREDSQLAAQILQSNDHLLLNSEFDVIIRIGRIPSFGLWRSLQRIKSIAKIPVFSFSCLPKFSGLGRESFSFNILNTDFSKPLKQLDLNWRNSLLQKDREFPGRLTELLAKFPKSEAALVRNFSDSVAAGSLLYLGNSLPIREWNEFASFNHKQLSIDANRGANGIDGQVASFFGALSGAGLNSNYCLIGDLTFLYDCNSLSLISQLKDRSFCLAVINNNGGKIMERLPYFAALNRTALQKSNFTGEHNLSCSGIARAFGLRATKLFTANEVFEHSNQMLLEILPDNEQSCLFNESLKAIVSGLLKSG